MTVPNLLSGLRILLTPFVVLGIVRGDPVLAGSCLGTALATDFLDGWWARRQQAFSPLGRILDPVADKILAAGVLVALVVTGQVPRELAIVVVLRDVVLLAFGWIRLRMGEPAPPAGPLGKVAFGVLGAYLAGEVVGIAWPVWAPAVVGVLYVGAGVAYAGRVPGFFAPGRVVRGDR